MQSLLFSVSTVAPLTTLAPLPEPVITGVPIEPVEESTKVSLRCSAETTDTDAQLYWYKGGERVSGTTHAIEVKKPSHILNSHTHQLLIKIG